MFTIAICGLLSVGLGLLFSVRILALFAPLLVTVAVVYCVGAPDPLWASVLWVVGLTTALNLGYLLGAAARFACVKQPRLVELGSAVGGARA